MPLNDRYHRVKELFLAARELPSEEREAYVRDACGHHADPSIADDVLAQLAADRATGDRGDGAVASFLGEPALRVELAPAYSPEAIPDRVGAYRILDKHRPLGQGGMGVVLLAEQDRPRRKVALKLIRPGHLTPQLRRRFEFESEVLGKLDHPGIARVYEAGVVRTALGEQPFFAMELVEGVKLGEHLERAKPSRDERLRLLEKIARAVQHAHGKGVVHRDLKPDNIMVDAAGEPKVLDFGVARATDAGTAGATMQTQSGHLVGTPAYMSPEQAAGRANEIDTTSDVYALGVLAYQMFAGRLPYELDGKPLHEAVRAICEEEPARLSSVDRSLRGDVDTVVAKCMSKERGRRYADAGEVAEEVSRILDYQPIRARPPSAFYNLSRFARRNKALVGAVAAVLAILAVGVAVSTTFAVRAVRQRDLAQRARLDAEQRAGELAMQRADWPTALSIFRALLASDTSRPFGVRLAYARCLTNTGDLAGAATACGAMRAEPLAADERARVLLAEGGCLATSDPDAAGSLLRQARPMLVQPSDAAWCDALLAPTLPAADAALREVLRRDPLHYQARSMLAVTLLARARMAEARVAIETLRDLSPSDPVPHLLLGIWGALRHDADATSEGAAAVAARLPAERAEGACRLIDLVAETMGGPNQPATEPISVAQADARISEISASCAWLGEHHMPFLPRALLDARSPMSSMLAASARGDLTDFHVAVNDLRHTFDTSEIHYLVAAANSRAAAGAPRAVTFDEAIVDEAMNAPSWADDKRPPRMMKMAALMAHTAADHVSFEVAEPQFLKMAAATMVEGGFTNIDYGPSTLTHVLREQGARLTAFQIARSWADNEPRNAEPLALVADIQLDLEQFDAAQGTIAQLGSLPGSEVEADRLRKRLRDRLESVGGRGAPKTQPHRERIVDWLPAPHRQDAAVSATMPALPFLPAGGAP